MTYSFFLGGHDLEMITIRELLCEQGAVVHDAGVSWGAAASRYRSEIKAELAAGNTIVLVELRDDLGVVELAGNNARRLVVVDHHNELAGSQVPTSLHQVFQLLNLPPESWTRRMELVAANDRGHILGLNEVGASQDEIVTIRTEDRAVQGISASEEESGRLAMQNAQILYGGRLAVIDLPHSRAAVVTDLNATEFGGPSCENLLVRCPDSTLFFGNGRAINFLKTAISGGWYGGSLPERGFWGIAPAVHEKAFEVVQQAMATKPAKDIEVRVYHDILIWPLLLSGCPPGKGPPLGRWVRVFTKHGPVGERWADRTTVGNSSDPTASIKEIANGFTYEQVVYFHSFVRDYWFGDGITKLEDRGVRRLVREDIHAVEVGIGDNAMRLQVERTELFLCKPNVALLVVEVSNCVRPENTPWDERFLRSIPLSLVQDFQDRFRRVYPAFWYDRKTKGAEAIQAGLCPQYVKWIIRSVTDIGSGEADDTTLCLGSERLTTSPARDFERFTSQGAEPPVFAHWEVFLKAIRPAKTNPYREHSVRSDNTPTDADRKLCRCQIHPIKGLSYQQVLDERMPSMAFLIVDNPNEISEGDYDRLTFVDSAGKDPYPYHKAFLDRDRASHSYDRFQTEGTRYFNCGYAFTVVGESGWFNTDVVRVHFRGIYLLMGLIAHYQRTGLLHFADEISSSKKIAIGLGAEEELVSAQLRRHIEKIQMQYKTFSARVFFPQITNVLQGQELFDLWFSKLQTSQLHAIVDASIKSMEDMLSNNHARQLDELAVDGIGLGAGIGLAALWLTGLSNAKPAAPFSSMWFVMPTTLGAFLCGWAIWSLIQCLMKKWRLRQRHKESR